MRGRTGAGRGSPTPDEAGFLAWATVRMPVIRRRAYFLCGDWHAADDLVQETLARVYARWSSIATGPNPDAYAMRVVVNLHVDRLRQPWRRERSMAALPDQADPAAERRISAVDDDDRILAEALQRLSPDHRVVLVLRFADDLSVDEVARILDVSSGTVKSRTSRAADALRALLRDAGHRSAVDGPRPLADVPLTREVIR